MGRSNSPPRHAETPPGTGVVIIEQPHYRRYFGTPRADRTAGYRRLVRLTALREPAVGSDGTVDRGMVRSLPRLGAAGFVGHDMQPPTLVTGSEKNYVRDTRHACRGRLMFTSSRTKSKKTQTGTPHRGEEPDRHRPGLGITQLTGKSGSTPGFPGA
jgi:hypothetical protein